MTEQCEPEGKKGNEREAKRQRKQGKNQRLENLGRLDVVFLAVLRVFWGPDRPLAPTPRREIKGEKMGRGS